MVKKTGDEEHLKASKAKPKKLSKYTGMRIKRTIKAIGEKNADSEHRSLANYVENLILNDDARRKR